MAPEEAASEADGDDPASGEIRYGGGPPVWGFTFIPICIRACPKHGRAIARKPLNPLSYPGLVGHVPGLCF